MTCERCRGLGFISSPLGYHVFCPDCSSRQMANAALVVRRDAHQQLQRETHAEASPEEMQGVRHGGDEYPIPDEGWGLDIEWKPSDTRKLLLVALGLLAGLVSIVVGLVHLGASIAQVLRG